MRFPALADQADLTPARPARRRGPRPLGWLIAALLLPLLFALV